MELSYSGRQSKSTRFLVCVKSRSSPVEMHYPASKDQATVCVYFLFHYFSRGLNVQSNSLLKKKEFRTFSSDWNLCPHTMWSIINSHYSAWHVMDFTIKIAPFLAAFCSKAFCPFTRSSLSNQALYCIFRLYISYLIDRELPRVKFSTAGFGTVFYTLQFSIGEEMQHRNATEDPVRSLYRSIIQLQNFVVKALSRWSSCTFFLWINNFSFLYHHKKNPANNMARSMEFSILGFLFCPIFSYNFSYNF